VENVPTADHEEIEQLEAEEGETGSEENE